ncbi:MAG: hypothetical protein IKG01_07250 [Lachnospiraceae bacterium]|nr:hypothetical protein [Lachnospiraceae bacterium]
MISSISIDKFGDIDSLQLQLKKFHKVGVSSGGDSLLTMLLVLSQSFLPGHAYDWQNVTRPGESSFGTGRLAVRGKMFDGGTFAKCLHEGSNYCSCGVEFVIENPENPVEDAGAAHRSNHGAAGLDGNNVADAERDRTSAVGAEQCRTSAADAKHAKKSRPPYADRKRAGADDFRELCRLFGEKFANVKRFALGIETSFAEKSDDNILSYQMVSIRCERVWDDDITSFFELVLYKNGTNYDLYWDELPDIRGVRTSGRAKGCNVRMRNLAVLDIVSDGVQDGARFEEVLPSVVRISRIAADQFGTLRFLDVRSQVVALGDGCNVGSQECAQDTSCYTESQECAQDTSCYTGSQECAQDTCCYAESQESGCCAGVQVSAQESGCHAGAQVYEQGPCYYVGVHGEYTEAVIRTYTEEKIRVAWPDPATGEIRHGLFAEAYEAWKKELGGSLRDESENKTGSPHFDRTWAEEAVLVQGLILRTGETLVLSGDAGLPDKFFDFLSRMGRQIVQIRSLPYA